MLVGKKSAQQVIDKAKLDLLAEGDFVCCGVSGLVSQRCW
jgi:hypothetical protein